MDQKIICILTLLNILCENNCIGEQTLENVFYNISVNGTLLITSTSINFTNVNINNSSGEYPTDNLLQYALLVHLIGFFLIFAVIIIAFIWTFRQKSPKRRDRYNFEQNNHFIDIDVLNRISKIQFPYGSYKEEIDNSFIPYVQVLQMRFIAAGNFGLVFKGVCDLKSEGSTKKKNVAVKIPQDFVNSPRKKNYDNFLNEIEIHFNISPHPNVITCYGKININGIIGMVLEYASNGTLKNYLHKLKKHGETKLTLKDPNFIYDFNKKCIKLSKDIASGMAHLAYHKVVHCDLAARNILMGSQNICKVSDFGSACYSSTEKKYLANSNIIPLRWYAPESIVDRIFSEKSDVWSFGILVWEIITLGCMPYKDLQLAAEIKEALESGYRLVIPTYCNSELSDIMNMCWNSDVTRPSFDELKEILSKFIVTSKHNYFKYRYSRNETTIATSF